MRLYLSSFRVGDHPKRLLDLAGSGRRVAVVGNALDAADDDVRRAGVDREIADMRQLGFDAVEADLRLSGRTEILADADVVWVRGGNVFVLCRAPADSGADEILVDMIRQDKIVYAGYSAAPAVLGPDLRRRTSRPFRTFRGA